MSEQAINALKKQRSVNKGKLTFIINSTKKAEASIEECRAKLNRVEKLMEEFTKIENAMFDLDQSLQPDMEYEQSYYTAVAELNKIIRKLGLNNAILNVSFENPLNTTQAVADIRLPKLNIPPFSGDYTEWQSFYDIYVSSVHDSASLSAVQKFQYLKGLLRGEAASLLRHFSITEASYIEAFQKLRLRYDRKRHTINAFIRSFLEQPSINNANHFNIRKLLDTSDEVLRGLKAMGSQGEHRDPWLTYILVSKLDDESKNLWAQATAEKEYPTIQELFDFLLKRGDALESLRGSSKRNSNRDSKASSVKSHIAVQEIKCSICQAEGHPIYQCPVFNGMDVHKRREIAKTNKYCFNCLSDKHAIFRCLSKRRCPTCKGKHHTLLHIADVELSKQPEEAIEKPTSSIKVFTSNSGQTDHAAHSILPTAFIKVMCASGKYVYCRALLDSGSQASFITEACLQRLGIPRHNGRVTVKGLGQVEAGTTKGRASVHIQPRKGPELTVKVFVLKRISKLPHININSTFCDIWKGLPLADPEFYKANDVDILIGIDHFFNILKDGQIKGNSNDPILQNTIFGWLVAGCTNNKNSHAEDALFGFNTNTELELNIDETLKRFWELESIPTVGSILSPEEKLCEDSFKENLQRKPDGRLQVRLPFKKPHTELGGSLSRAIQRLKGLERRFIQDKDFHVSYKKFIDEYLSLGHMIEVPPTVVKDDGFFLPHHGVLKKDSSTTKLRVVFDGSAKSSSGVSLNDCLAVGPTVQSTLYAIILRFREHRIVFCADIEKMYRQIRIHDDDTNFQKIVWREDSSQPIRYFKLCTVTYGLASASYLATKAINQVACDIMNSEPDTAKVIQQNIYVDDLMTGGDTLDQVINLKTSTKTTLLKYGFKLRKWISNSPEVLKDIPDEDKEFQIKTFEDTTINQSVKVLGLQYDPTKDQFSFHVDLAASTIPLSKRKILSEAGKIFDPMGWIAPVNVKIKIFIQRLWYLNVNWDDPLPEPETKEWELIRSTLPKIQEVSIPRYVQTSQESKIELHGFCDASQLAYAAVVYFKIITKKGETFCHLITSKTKVAPIKQQSLPRLELCGAVLLTNLVNLVKPESNVNVQDIYLWTDSTIVLDWLSSHPRRWPTFVANRTSQVLSLFGRTHWYHVPSPQNPADIASRGLFPHELKCNALWWNGPDWLTQPNESWPPQKINYAHFQANENISCTTTIEYDVLDNLISKHSSFHKIQRIMAYVLSFIAALKKQRLAGSNQLFVNREELYESLFIICRYDQRKYFLPELTDVKVFQMVKPSSNLKSLSPFIDDSGVLRVGGRLENYNSSFSTRHPIILSSKSPVSKLIIEEMHRNNKHAGPSLLLALSRQQYWIPGAKNLIRQVIHNCVKCVRQKATNETQLMGNLPSYRLELIRPFIKVGVDYAGPLQIHLTKGRGQKNYKAYICLFICLSTKAIHIELVTDLSSDAFLAALKRFVARRGCCQEIYSDNGSNFIGANNQLQYSFSNCIKLSNEISHFCSRNAINWHFIPPNAPHFGGIWESAIKSTKFHLRRVIGDTILTMEEMITLLTEIESILNSRPLCVLSSEEFDALTPSHFLIGQATTKIPECDVSHLKPSHLSRWQMLQYMQQHFWKRWNLEYITSLQQKVKWLKQNSSININDIVVIKEDNIPVCKWLLGKIIKLHPGSDGFTRVVTLKTKNGELKRPLSKLARLPVEPSCSKPAVCS